VPLDEVRSWWRYHHLFADLLRARLQAEQPGRAVALHRAAAAWSEEHDLADDAVRHALAAGEVAWAARVMEQHVETLLGRGEGVTLRRWLSALPAESVRARPRLCLAQAYGAAMGCQTEALEALLDDAEHAYAATGDDPYADPAGRPVSVLANVPAGIAFLRASLARLRGDAALAADYNRQTQAELGEDEWLMRSFVRWNGAAVDWLGGRLGPAERGLTEVLAERRAAGEAVRRVGGEPAEVFRAVAGGAGFFAGFLAMRVCYDLGAVQRAQGNLDAALATYRHALDTAVVSSQTAHTGLAHVGLAQVLYERDELDAALDHANRGVTLCRWLGYTPPLAIGLAVVAWIRHAHGDAAGALEAMGEAGQAGLSPQVTALLNPVPSQRARLLLALGDVHAAARWTTAAGLGPDDGPDYPPGAGVSGAGRGAARPRRPRPGAHTAATAARRRRQPGPGRQHHRDRRAAGAGAGRPRRSRRRRRRADRGAHARPPAGLCAGLRRRGRADARPAHPAARGPAGPAARG
jgi:LuxR family transcriptional regulator, maltose regulon positive regulatory protein